MPRLGSPRKNAGWQDEFLMVPPRIFSGFPLVIAAD
jgi:hypothetical protein